MENGFLGSDSVSHFLGSGSVSHLPVFVDINCSAPQLPSLLSEENEGAPIMELFGG